MHISPGRRGCGGEWLPYQTPLRQVIAELLDQSRQNPLRSLAQRTGVPA
ncbi:hypothetical protein [Nocardia australiensis]|nr:hypothetical protein [Nocardia australiensis]